MKINPVKLLGEALTVGIGAEAVLGTVAANVATLHVPAGIQALLSSVTAVVVVAVGVIRELISEFEPKTSSSVS